MNYDDALNRLKSHSNLPGTDIHETESLIWNLWNANSTGAIPKIQDLADDVIACLRVVNSELNGFVPNESNADVRNERGILEVAYAVSGIINTCLRYHISWFKDERFDSTTCNLLEHSAYMISYAWDQVLAGDTEDILEGFDIENNT